MRAGTLRRLVTIEQRSTAKDSANQVLEQWTQVAQVYADIQPVTGRETQAANGMVSVVSAQIDIRYRAGVTAAMRVRYGAQIYNVAAVLDLDSRHEITRLLCSSGANQG